MAETFSDSGISGITAGATTPTYNTRKNSRPFVNITKFGDGYEQRQMIGIPAQMDPKTYSLTFKVAETDSDKIEAFFEARAADGSYFNWTPPSGGSGKYVCDTWSKSIPYQNRATIVATFRQVFDLA